MLNDKVSSYCEDPDVEDDYIDYFEDEENHFVNRETESEDDNNKEIPEPDIYLAVQIQTKQLILTAMQRIPGENVIRRLMCQLITSWKVH
jgi:hypothetical protein